MGLTACRPPPLWAVALGSERGLHIHGKAGSCRGACASASLAAVCAGWVVGSFTGLLTLVYTFASLAGKGF